MKSGQGHIGPRLFGDAADIGVQRGLAEFRAGRPVRIEAADESILALPVDGSGPIAAAAFDPPLVTVAAGAVARFRREIIRSLSIAGEAQVPLNTGLTTRFVVFRDAIGGGPIAIIVGKPDFSRPVPI